MTYCDTLTEPLRRRIESGETLDEIGSALCGSTVKNPKRKAIRLIKSLLGESILKKNAQSLHYNANKGNRIKGLSEEPQQRNFVTKDTGELQSNAETDTVPHHINQEPPCHDIVTATDGGLTPSSQEPEEELVRTIDELVRRYGYPAVSTALQSFVQNTIPTEAKT